ncbi:MAG: hypothetical protein CL920_35235 [Deltaproteobacteria bacterium]|nr:hypothetical protein [Deltaproteobacteria bacterium]MBU53978.1 hypothetical protein [Deltaproteobacteria bacterium]|tara:strand:+ start:2049 stop:3053 length:1005 start_codon:yes stop_codon:yes gene_type:complete
MKILTPKQWGTGVRIASFGAQLGVEKRDNARLHALGYPEAPEKIERLTGIQTRYHVRDESSATLAIQAAQGAMRSAHIAPSSIEQLIVSSSSPEQLIPTLASRVHAGLSLPPCPAHSISASCSGFLFALDIATRAVLTGTSHVLVCATETRSRQIDITDHSTGALFGDAAGAAIVQSCPTDEGLLAIGITSQDSGRETVSLGCLRDDRLQMKDGARVYFEAVNGMKQIGEALLESQGLTWEDIDVVIPHQANGRILKRFCWLTEIPEEKAFSNLREVGNTSSASIPVATHQALRTRIKPGQLILMLAIGAGFTAGAALLKADEALVHTAQSVDG